MNEWSRILPPLRRVRRRLRLQAAAELAARLAIPALAGLLVAIYLWKLRVLPGAGLARVALSVLAVSAVGALLGAGRRIPLRRAARAADRATGLHDRLGSALEFGADTRDPFQRAAILDAGRHAARVVPRAAAPLRPPGDLPAVGALALAALLLLLVRVPERHLPAPPPPPHAATLSLTADDLLAEHELARTLQREATRDQDAQVGDLALKLQQLLDDLEAGRLTREEAFEKLAEIEQLLQQSPEGDFEPLLKELRALGQTLAKEKPTEELGRALKEDELTLAQEELERIARRLQEEKLSPKEREALARALDQSKTNTAAEEAKERREREALERQERRLKRELEKRPTREELRRRLEQKRRELERLTRQQERRQDQRRRLERLTRDMRQAGQQARGGQRQQAANSARQAAQEMGRFANEMRRGQAGQRLAAQLTELKDTVRRARLGQGGAGKAGQQGKQGKPGLAANRDGKGGTGKAGKGKLADFYRRAKGQAPRPGDLLVPEAGGDISMEMPGAAQPGPGGERPGPPQPGAGPDSPQGQPGDGIGDSHDPNLQGDTTRLRARHKNVLVPGKEGAGPTRAETILGASERGFASRSYRRVYRDYTSVAEEAMDREKVPLGFKHYVKRYFRLIMPRE